AGADAKEIERALRTIVADGWTLEMSRVDRRGVAATYLDFVVPGEDSHHEHPHAHAHPPQRPLGEILAIVDASGLNADQKKRVHAIFRRLAEAEADVHGERIEDVHFHEVGQIDAILDVAATCVALDMLGVERVFCSPYPLGRGPISMHHGNYPNPPPATARLMLGAPTFQADVDGEMVTTTAAAILATFVAQPGTRPAMTWERIGYGAGRSDFPIPNVTRITIGELTEAASSDEVVILETNLDDMSPQHFELAQERLLQAGALDVWTSAIGMKKSRPGVLLSAIAPHDRADACAQTMLRETTTLGVRMSTVRRLTAAREIVKVSTPIGEVRVKRARIDGGVRDSLEYDDVLKIARQRGEPIAEIASALERFVRESNGR
ncbi:MAG: nickel pincer cofactor biosynthesis protein LarC, partial [Vulcanimicrobiaceae bacterium]